MTTDSLSYPSGDAATPSRRYSYQRAADVSGRSGWDLLPWLVLLPAAGADVAAFHQVVSLVMAKEEDWLIMLLVVGLTVVALALAHFGGRCAREVASGAGQATWRSVLWCAVPWLLLGLAAVVVRAIVAADTGPVQINPGAPPTDESSDQYAAAFLFAVLYGGSGMVAAIAEFFNHNPLRGEYRRALRHHDTAQRRLRKSRPEYERAVHVCQLHRQAMDQDYLNWRAARRKVLDYGDELKKYSAVLIAAHLQDPPATDGMTEPDWRPGRAVRRAARRAASPPAPTASPPAPTESSPAARTGEFGSAKPSASSGGFGGHLPGQRPAPTANNHPRMS